MTEFHAYVLRFYGQNGLYPMGVTEADVAAATDIVIASNPNSFCGDSVDRERVRDVLIDTFGFTFPE